MKKLLLLMLHWGILFSSYSQNEPNGFSSILSTQANTPLETQNDTQLKYNTPEKKGISIFSLAIGINLANISGDDKKYEGGIAGFVGGFNITLAKFGKAFILDGGLFYSQQGSKYKTNGSTTGGGQDEETIATRKLNCLNLPLSLRYQPNQEKGFFAEAGMQGGLLLSAKEAEGNNNGNIDDIFNPLNAAVLAGVGCQFNPRLKAGIRVVTGFTNINQKTEDSVFDNHMVVSAMFSYSPFKN